MASRDGRGAEPQGTETEELSARIQVQDEGRRLPFMRGIMVHSLMARGVSFEAAYEAANQVRERLAGQALVEKRVIAQTLREILGEEIFREAPPPAPPAEILVTEKGQARGRPFSKGVLSQSLLAAGIDPQDAFDVARELEAELRRRGAREIDRSELRRHAYATLSRRLGEQPAARYLVWRKYQDPERPVILLLGGATGVGKSTLALEVAHRLGIGRVLSTDSIRQIMRIMLSRELAPAIHGSSYDAHRLLAAVPTGEDPVIQGFQAQSAIVAVGARASIDRAVDENASLVLDGVALVPGLIDLEAYDEIADVIFLVVATLDEEAYADRFEARAAGATRRGKHRYLENFDAIRRVQDRVLELADRHHVPIVDNVSFDRSVLLIIRHVTESLRERGHLDVADLL